MSWYVRWHWYETVDGSEGWWQAQIVSHDPLRWQFVALVEYE